LDVLTMLWGGYSLLARWRSGCALGDRLRFGVVLFHAETPHGGDMDVANIARACADALALPPTPKS
jgi:hypothetical protein